MRTSRAAAETAEGMGERAPGTGRGARGSARKPLREAPEPLEGNDLAIVTGGTIAWFVLFLVQLPFYGWFSAHGHAWWIWTCLAGTVLGLIGLWYVRRRRAATRRGREAERG